MVKMMSSVLQQEIKQSKPFSSLHQEAWLNLSKTSAALGHRLEHSLRAFGLSLTQYNVLRILRGAGTEGLCQYEIRGRLVAQVPDVPRILERMQKAGWIRRTRAASDRRVVMTALTESGCVLVGTAGRAAQGDDGRNVPAAGATGARHAERPAGARTGGQSLRPAGGLSAPMRAAEPTAFEDRQEQG